MNEWIDEATGNKPLPKSHGLDGMAVSYRNRSVDAERASRQIIEVLQGFESVEDLREHFEAESLVIDAMNFDWPEYAARIVDAYEDQKILLTAGAQSAARLSERKPRTADPCINTKAIRMANNTDFLKIVVKDVDFLWPRLDQTYRFNSTDKKTEPCPPTATNAGYSLAWKTSLAEGKKLKDQLRAHYEACREGNKKLPEFSDVFGAKRLNDEDGNPTDFVQFTAKKRAMSNDGKENKPPQVVGPDLQDLDNKAIWSGSKGHIRALAFPTTDPDGIGGISLLLDAVQVTHAEYGGDGLEDDFGPAQVAEPDFGDSKPAPAERRSSDEF